MVYHVTLCTEALSTLLGALKRSRVVVNPHVNRQIMAIVELLLTCLDRAENVLSGKVVGHVGLHVLLLPEFFCTAFVRTLEELHGSWLAISAFE